MQKVKVDVICFLYVQSTGSLQATKSRAITRSKLVLVTRGLLRAKEASWVHVRTEPVESVHRAGFFVYFIIVYGFFNKV